MQWETATLAEFPQCMKQKRLWAEKYSRAGMPFLNVQKPHIRPCRTMNVMRQGTFLLQDSIHEFQHPVFTYPQP